MIRKATNEDLEIINNICQSHKALISTLEDNDYKEWLSYHIEKSLFFVYCKEDNVIGFIFGEKLLGNGILLWMSGVFDEYLNLGIGVKLEKYLEQEAKNKGFEWIIVYGYTNNDVVEKILLKSDFKTNNNTYKEYLKYL